MAPVGGTFPATRWTMVLSARDQALPALARLCETYQPPVHAFLRSHGVPPQDIEDLAQGFFVTVLQPGFLKQVAPEKGRFRSFLLASLRHYLGRQAAAAGALKRGGGLPHCPLHGERSEDGIQLAGGGLRPDEAFDVAWAKALLSAALKRLQAEAAWPARQALLAEVLPCLYGQAPAETHGRIAAKLGMREGAVRTAVHRIRQRLRQLIREELLATLPENADPEAEMRELASILARR